MDRPNEIHDTISDASSEAPLSGEAPAGRTAPSVHAIAARALGLKVSAGLSWRTLELASPDEPATPVPAIRRFPRLSP